MSPPHPLSSPGGALAAAGTILLLLLAAISPNSPSPSSPSPSSLPRRLLLSLPPRARGGTGVVYHEGMLLHAPPAGGHVEVPGRAAAVHEELRARGLLSRCAEVPARPAADDELLALHTAAHIRGVEQGHASRGGGVGATHAEGDMYYSGGTAMAARLAAGGVIDLAERVARGELRNGFAVTRPPGHHAGRETAEGFCFYNNVALAARRVVDERLGGVERVLILDWDVHHGNGIQDLLYDDPRVLYISLHQSGIYPGTGAAEEVGSGAGAGFTVNIPWGEGKGDGDYLAAMEEVVMPRAREFDPGLVIVSAGFDSAAGDPLGGMDLTPGGFAAMTHRLQQLAGGRVVAALEGGYNARTTARCAAAVVGALLAPPPAPGGRRGAAGGGGLPRARAGREARAAIDDVLAAHRAGRPPRFK